MIFKVICFLFLPIFCFCTSKTTKIHRKGDLKSTRVAIIGAGWYGCHLALALKKEGYNVTLYEKNRTIFSEISGHFGIRLHSGLHYPRSPETRKSCQRGFHKFREVYPELIIPHEYSIYGLGKKDADGNRSKVSPKAFQKVCEEVVTCHPFDFTSFGYIGLHNAYNVEEPSIFLGGKLRAVFTKRINDLEVDLQCNSYINKIEYNNQKMQVFISNKTSPVVFDKVINTTSFQEHFPSQQLPFDIEIAYQPCLGLIYKDKTPGIHPFSFIVMDGWFPCLMPYIELDEDFENLSRKYILTHGKWTILGTYKTPKEAKEVLCKLNEKFVKENIRLFAEREIKRFWPIFLDRFEYVGWKGAVLAKLKTRREFRSAITFEAEGIIHVIPGKIINIFDVENEVLSLIERKNICRNNGYLYIKNGVLDASLSETTEKPSLHESNTCNLQTYNEIKRKAE